MLTCKGRIYEPVNLSERFLNFGELKFGQSSEPQAITITRGDGGPIKPELEPGGNQIVDAIIREIEAGEKYELSVRIKSDVPTSNGAKEPLTFKTGVKESTTAEVYVYALTTPLVQPSPSQLVLSDKRSNAWQQNVKLIWSDS